MLLKDHFVRPTPIRTCVAESDWELSNFFHEVGFENSGLLIYTRTVPI